MGNARAAAIGDARVLGATVKGRAGRWWISFQIEIDRAELGQRRAVPPDAPACGIDLGLRKLRKANKALARSRRGSANRAKRRAEVARVHLETLNVTGMAGNRRLARAIADAGWGEFLRQLDYKTRWYGSRVWKADLAGKFPGEAKRLWRPHQTPACRSNGQRSRKNH